MARKILASVERLLITAASLLLVAIVIAMFVRAVRAPVSGVAAAVPASRPPAADVLAPTDSVGTTVTTTTSGAADAVTPPPSVDVTVFPSGPCQEEVPPAEDGTTLLRVYYTCGNGGLPTGDTFVYRLVPETARVLGATLEQLVKGPTNAEGDLGFRSVFTIADSSAIDSASLSAGEAVIDFVSLPEVSGLAPSDDAAFFVANLNANVFQFATINSVEYRIDGSCAAFWAHVGLGTGCRVIARENFEAEMAANRER